MAVPRRRRPVLSLCPLSAPATYLLTRRVGTAGPCPQPPVQYSQRNRLLRATQTPGKKFNLMAFRPGHEVDTTRLAGPVTMAGKAELALAEEFEFVGQSEEEEEEEEEAEEEEEEESEEEESSGGGFPLLLVIVLLAAAGGAYYYYTMM